MRQIKEKMCKQCGTGTINSYSATSTITKKPICSECKLKEILGDFKARP